MDKTTTENLIPTTNTSNRPLEFDKDVLFIIRILKDFHQVDEAEKIVNKAIKTNNITDIRYVPFYIMDKKLWHNGNKNNKLTINFTCNYAQYMFTIIRKEINFDGTTGRIIKWTYYFDDQTYKYEYQ